MTTIVKIDTKGIDELLREQPGRIDRFLRGVAEDMVTQVKGDIQRQSFGHIAVRYDPKRNVVVSAEGDAPNVDTGALMNSIDWRKVRKGEFWVHDGVVYGEPLELVHNRPFISPVFDDWRRGKFAREAQRRLFKK